jgi:hypothetical protein
MPAPKGNKYAVGANSGRDSTYTADTGRKICDRIASGEGLKAICRDEHMPPERTVYGWLRAVEEFRQLYRKARELQAEGMLDELLELSDWQPPEKPDGTIDTGFVQWKKLQVDARKWAMSRLLPRKYGDKIGLTGDDGGPVRVVHRIELVPLLPLAGRTIEHDDAD